MKSHFFSLFYVVVALYAGMHFYAYNKIAAFKSINSAGRLAIFLFLCLMVMAHFLIRLMTRLGFTTLTVPFSWVSYIWMSFIFLFFFLSLGLDLYRVVATNTDKVTKWDLSPITFSPQSATLISAGLSLLLLGYGFFAARKINTELVKIKTSRISKENNPLTIVQISDLHVSYMTDKAHFQKIIETIKTMQPDILVSTGDLVDRHMDHLNEFADLLSQLKPHLGKYAVTGNHEYHAGLEKALRFTKRAGFTVLSDEGIQVAGIINIIGVDDATARGGGGLVERDLLQRFPRDKFTLLLKHRPDIIQESLPFFDLQLSGHTHGGQIFPFIFLTKLAYPIKHGLSHLGKDTVLYLSRGTGTWGPPIRILAPPEITVIKLQAKT